MTITIATAHPDTPLPLKEALGHMEAAWAACQDARLLVNEAPPELSHVEFNRVLFDEHGVCVEVAAWRANWLVWVEVRVTYAVVRVNELERRLVDPLPCEVWAAALELLAGAPQ
jgi:hypothetical protein